MKKLLALSLLLSGCIESGGIPVTLPYVAMTTWPGQDYVVDYDDSCEAWSPLGFRCDRVDVPRCDQGWSYGDDPDCLFDVGVKRQPNLVETDGTLAYSNRSGRFMVVDSDMGDAYHLRIAVAHELGHIILDTSQHTQGGIMGGSSDVMLDVDYWLACDEIGVCR